MTNTRRYFLTPLCLPVVLLLLSRPIEMEGLKSTSSSGALKQPDERAVHQPRMALDKHRAAPHGIWLPVLKAGQFRAMRIADGRGVALPFPLSAFLLPQPSPRLPINNTTDPAQ